MPVTRMIQTSDWRVEPTTQLTSTVRVLAATRAISTTSRATRAPANAYSFVRCAYRRARSPRASSSPERTSGSVSAGRVKSMED